MPEDFQKRKNRLKVFPMNQRNELCSEYFWTQFLRGSLFCVAGEESRWRVGRQVSTDKDLHLLVCRQIQLKAGRLWGTTTTRVRTIWEKRAKVSAGRLFQRIDEKMRSRKAHLDQKVGQPRPILEQEANVFTGNMDLQQ